MKTTQAYFRQILKEEIRKLLNEQIADPVPRDPPRTYEASDEEELRRTYASSDDPGIRMQSRERYGSTPSRGSDFALSPTGGRSSRAIEDARTQSAINYYQDERDLADRLSDIPSDPERRPTVAQTMPSYIRSAHTPQTDREDAQARRHQTQQGRQGDLESQQFDLRVSRALADHPLPPPRPGESEPEAGARGPIVLNQPGGVEHPRGAAIRQARGERQAGRNQQARDLLDQRWGDRRQEIRTLEDTPEAERTREQQDTLNRTQRWRQAYDIATTAEEAGGAGWSPALGREALRQRSPMAYRELFGQTHVAAEEEGEDPSLWDDLGAGWESFRRRFR
jgi:hypothetical protein